MDEKVNQSFDRPSQEVIDLMSGYGEVLERVVMLKEKLRPLYYEHIRTCYGCPECNPLCPKCILRE